MKICSSLPGVLSLVASIMEISAAVVMPLEGESESMAHTVTVPSPSVASIVMGRVTVATESVQIMTFP